MAPQRRLLLGSCLADRQVAGGRRRTTGVEPPRRAFRGPAARLSTERAKDVKFTATLTTNIPFREHPEVPFEQYIKNRERIFHTFFPDRQRYVRLDEEHWRIQMLPISFFWLQVTPVVDMRIWLAEGGAGRAPHAEGAGGTQLCLQATRWVLRGVEYDPADFALEVRGALHPERIGHANTRLRGDMDLTVGLAVPSNLMFIPRPTVEAVGSALLRQLLGSMKEKVNSRLLADYAEYAKEQLALRPQQMR